MLDELLRVAPGAQILAQLHIAEFAGSGGVQHLGGLLPEPNDVTDHAEERGAQEVAALGEEPIEAVRAPLELPCSDR